MKTVAEKDIFKIVDSLRNVVNLFSLFHLRKKAAMQLEQTASGGTVSTNQISSVQLVTEAAKKPPATCRSPAASMKLNTSKQ